MKKLALLMFAGGLIFSRHTLAQSKSDVGSLQNEAAKQLELAMQKQEEAMQLHKAALQNMQEAIALQEAAGQKQQQTIGKQKENAVKQQELMQEQQQQMKEQERIEWVLKAELLKDSIVQGGKHYELKLNTQELLINGKKQPDAVHKKYIELINRERKKPFGDSEEWRWREYGMDN